MRDLAVQHRALTLTSGNEVLPPALKPLFAPALLDARAAGTIDTARPDPEIVQKARKLPMHWFDW